MRRVLFGVALLGAFVLLPGAASAFASDDANHFTARLSGFNEVTPKLTDGAATVRITVNDNSSLTYTLTFSGLSSGVIQSHLHFAQRGVNGGIFLFLCGTAASPGPAGTPTCAPNTTITRTVTGADILAPNPDQGLSAGDFAGALRILRAGEAYANVHSTRFPGGEIRGQVREGEDD